MATKKYLSYDRLAEYDALIKIKIDESAENVKNDLLNGAGDAYDTLKELGDLINENVDAIEALETIATGKASQVDLDNTDARVNELSANVGYINIDNNEDVEEAKENILPTVSNADNGKILAVVNGIWTAVSLINSEEVSY